jgi:hypothetical protein
MSRGILAGLLALLLGAAAGCPTPTTGTPTPASRPAASEPTRTQPDGGTTPKATYPEHIPSGN